MRAEDKDVDGLELEREEREQETTLAEHKEEVDELPTLAGEEARDIGHESGPRLLDAIKMILDRDHLVVSHLGLPARETLALEALQAAVNGRTTNVNMFVFAEDRRSLLEQALAVLQPNLTSGKSGELAELHGAIESVTRRVGRLRMELSSLKDSQEELLGDERARFQRAWASGKPTEQVDPDAPKPASSLAGPGPEVKREDRPSTLSTGPEAKLEETPSTLSTGPEVKRAEQPTTLGDPADIEQAAATPWWRK